MPPLPHVKRCKIGCRGCSCRSSSKNHSPDFQGYHELTNVTNTQAYYLVGKNSAKTGEDIATDARAIPPQDKYTEPKTQKQVGDARMKSVADQAPKTAYSDPKRSPNYPEEAGGDVSAGELAKANQMALVSDFFQTALLVAYLFP